MKDKRPGTFLFVTLAAAATGAGIALLTAPRSGRETRTRLKERADDLKRKAGQQADATRQAVNQRLDRGKEIRNAVVKSFRETKDQLHDSANHNEDIKSAINRSWNEEV